MIILDATTKKLQVLLDAAAATTELPVTVSWVDVTTTTYTPGCTDSITTGTTAVDFVAAPAASTQRQIKFIAIPNVDTAVRTVTVRYNNGGTTRKMIVAALAVGDILVYSDGEGFRVHDANGSVKSAAVRTTNDRMRSVGLGVDGGATAVTTGTKSGRVQVPYSGRIQKVTVLGVGGTGSCVIDIWKDTYANYPATVADTITAAAKPTITTATKYQDSTLTGWNTVVTAGDHFIINVDSNATFTAIFVFLDLLTD